MRKPHPFTIRDAMQDGIARLSASLQGTPSSLTLAVSEVIAVAAQLTYWNNRAHRIAMQANWDVTPEPVQRKFVEDALDSSAVKAS